MIWFCDLRDSTPLADSMSRRDFLALLNDYFECVLGPVVEQGGDVLRFIGDAALAIFPVGERPAEACARALAAAREALVRMEAHNQTRSRPQAGNDAEHEDLDAVAGQEFGKVRPESPTLAPAAPVVPAPPARKPTVTNPESFFFPVDDPKSRLRR